MLPSMELMLASSFGRYDHMTVGRVLPEARDGVLVALPGRAVDDSDLKTLPFEEGLNGRLCLDFKRAILASKVGQHARTAASPPLGLARRLLAGNALVPHLWGASLSNRRSARTSTRFGRSPPGGVTQYTEPEGSDQSTSNLSRRPTSSASRKMNSGRMPRPTPAIKAGIMASPLLTRSGPDGRTLADFPFLCVKRQVSAAVPWP